jgi:predicted GNAT family acetyltransferase
MWVEPDWRRRGIGGTLVDVVIGWAVEQGFDSLRLWVAEGNVAAELLYASLGFRRTGDVQPMGGSSRRLEFAMWRELSRTG